MIVPIFHKLKEYHSRTLLYLSTRPCVLVIRHFIVLQLLRRQRDWGRRRNLRNRIVILSLLMLTILMVDLLTGYMVNL